MGTTSLRPSRKAPCIVPYPHPVMQGYVQPVIIIEVHRCGSRLWFKQFEQPSLFLSLQAMAPKKQTTTKRKEVQVKKKEWKGPWKKILLVAKEKPKTAAAPPDATTEAATAEAATAAPPAATAKAAPTSATPPAAGQATVATNDPSVPPEEPPADAPPPVIETETSRDSKKFPKISSSQLQIDSSSPPPPRTNLEDTADESSPPFKKLRTSVLDADGLEGAMEAMEEDPEEDMHPLQTIARRAATQTGTTTASTAAAPEPAETAQGDSSQSFSYSKATLTGKTALAKVINNKFKIQERYMEKTELELMAHWRDLQKGHRGCHEVADFKRIIAEAGVGKFDTPEILALKKRLKIKQWNEQKMLVSWDEVVKKYGECSAYTALSQGTLPYVPHTLLMPGHQVQWPNSHQFVLSRQFWTATWKDELDFLVGREDEMPSHETINRFLRENGFIGGKEAIPYRPAPP